MVLDESWFAAARAAANQLPVVAGCTYCVELRTAEGLVWHEVVDEGRMRSWGLGPAPAPHGPDLVLAVGEWLVERYYAPDLDGTSALEVVRVVRPDGTEALSAPMDITETAELAALPVIPDADLLVQFHFSQGPFGAADMWWQVIAGQVTAAELGTTDAPEVEVWLTFPKLAALRRGESTVLEALEDGGRVKGDVGPLMLLAGLHESPEMRAADLAAGPSAEVLAHIGSLRSTPGFRQVLSALAEP